MTKEAKAGPRISYFVGASVVYVGMACGIAAFHWSAIADLKPNEWADILAGVFSPLAFFWFLYSALAQRAELELQRKELTQSNASFDRQAAALEAHARASDEMARWARAKADGEYQPFFTLDTSRSSPEGHTIVTVRNVGGALFNVQCSDADLLMLGRGAAIRGNVLPVWPKNGEVDIRLVSTLPESDHRYAPEDRALTISGRRHDGTPFLGRLVYLNAEQRIDSRESTSLDL